MRHLLTIGDLTRDGLCALLERGAALDGGASPRHAEGAVATVFYENSTRTRLSFQQAGAMLGLTHLTITAEGSSIQKGENLEDTLRTLWALGAVVAAVRTSEGGVLGAASDSLSDLPLHLVNAGDGWYQHPTQALADLLAVQGALGGIEGRTLLVVGDVLHSRVARSGSQAFRMLGARVLFAGPKTLLPSGIAEALGGQEIALEEGLRAADIVLVLRLQRERQASGYLPSVEEYRRFWGLTAQRLGQMQPHAVVLHPGPQNRGIEIDPEVITAPCSLIARQIRCGISMRAALLEAMLDAH